MEAARIGDATQRSAEEQRREKQLRQIVADQIPVLAKSLSVTRLAEGIETQNVALDGLEHSVSSLRHLRVGGVLFLMALAAVLGAGAMGGLFYTSYENGRQAVANWDFFSARGIHFHAHETDIAVIVTVEGPEIIADGTGLKKDDQDRTIGANLAFSK